MSRVLFIGDSHTCGYVSEPGKVGIGSYSFWNDNNYAELYGYENKKATAIYSMAGVSNRMYTDWMTSMFQKYSDIDEVFLCLAPMNRFTLGFETTLTDEVIPLDHFTGDLKSNTDMLARYSDLMQTEGYVQLLQKPVYDDYSNFPGFELSIENGLIKPDLRKHTYAQIKLFFELNTYIEKRDFLLNMYVWDRLCAEHGAKLYIFQMTDRLKYPSNYEYYGKLQTTTISTKTVEGFFKSRMLDHKKYFIEDKEHYNKEYHHMIATQFLPWLKS